MAMDSNKKRTEEATIKKISKSNDFSHSIFKMLEKHVLLTGVPFRSKGEIKNWLNARSIRTSSGKKVWQTTQVSRVLNKLKLNEKEFLFTYIDEEDINEEDSEFDYSKMMTENDFSY